MPLGWDRAEYVLYCQRYLECYRVQREICAVAFCYGFFAPQIKNKESL